MMLNCTELFPASKQDGYIVERATCSIRADDIKQVTETALLQFDGSVIYASTLRVRNRNAEVLIEGKASTTIKKIRAALTEKSND